MYCAPTNSQWIIVPNESETCLELSWSCAVSATLTRLSSNLCQQLKNTDFVGKGRGGSIVWDPSATVPAACKASQWG